jgi:oxygen-independent coproporphyrinogen-3 oxidase
MGERNRLQRNQSRFGFGLPHQTWEAMESTIRKTMELKPDRLAFYSYAHVPWVKGVGQRGFDENDLPSGEEKRRLYEDGKKLLEELGYIEVGMDHFLWNMMICTNL